MGEMEGGFMFGRVAQGDLSLIGWSNGTPEASLWAGLKLKEDRQTVTYRCTNCGFLEFYAI
jgi:hypothetical protein